jgi:hypothetical protein
VHILLFFVTAVANISEIMLSSDIEESEGLSQISQSSFAEMETTFNDSDVDVIILSSSDGF